MKDLIVILCEITLSVSPNGATVERIRLKTKFTGANYIPIQPTHAERSAGYSGYYRRIPRGELGYIQLGRPTDYSAFFTYWGFCREEEQLAFFEYLREHVTGSLIGRELSAMRSIERWEQNLTDISKVVCPT